jgi:aspartate carbamoyltransferase regulatory subunit
MVRDGLKVSRIKQGTVIDHIRPGMALTVLHILGIGQGFPHTVVVAMNVSSGKIGSKDIVKVENQVLDEETLQKISIVSPHATVNIIRDFEVAAKHHVSLPKEIHGIVKCPNRNCLSNAAHERVSSFFFCEREEPAEFRCHYCETLIAAESVELIA